MATSAIEVEAAAAERVALTDDTLTVELRDGRTLAVPLSWFPRLVQASPSERAAWRLIGRGEGLHWPALDEDISVAGLLAGRRSAESSASLAAWLAGRGAPDAG